METFHIVSFLFQCVPIEHNFLFTMLYKLCACVISAMVSFVTNGLPTAGVLSILKASNSEGLSIWID